MRKISVDSFLDASGFSCRTRLNRFRSFSLNATSSPPIKICSTSIQVLEDLSRSKAEDFFTLVINAPRGARTVSANARADSQSS